MTGESESGGSNSEVGIGRFLSLVDMGIAYAFTLLLFAATLELLAGIGDSYQAPVWYAVLCLVGWMALFVWFLRVRNSFDWKATLALIAILLGPWIVLVGVAYQ